MERREGRRMTSSCAKNETHERTEYVSNLEVLAYMLARELSDAFLDMAREDGAGNTNVAVVRRKRDTLLAFLKQANNDDDSQPSDFRQPL